jgi:hypothetical protein
MLFPDFVVCTGRSPLTTRDKDEAARPFVHPVLRAMPLRFMIGYQLRPSANGLVFSTHSPRASRACNENIEIPWSKLKPFLARKGKEAMRSIREAAAATSARRETVE